MTDTVGEVLDLYCCQGGASAGYERIGLRARGVDKAFQKHYPYDFIQADALEYLDKIIATGEVERYALVSASPPCQRRTKAQKIQKRDHPALIGPTRELLVKSGRPWVIENVVPEDPDLDDDPLIDPVMLCGAMFPGLHTYRHRLFETSFPVKAPEHPAHIHPTVKMGRPLQVGEWYHAVGNFSNVPYVRNDLGVPWMTRDGMRECIPPAYSEYIGRAFLGLK